MNQTPVSALNSKLQKGNEKKLFLNLNQGSTSIQPSFYIYKIYMNNLIIDILKQRPKITAEHSITKKDSTVLAAPCWWRQENGVARFEIFSIIRILMKRIS